MKITKLFGGHKVVMIEKGDPEPTEEEKREFIAETNRLINGLNEQIKKIKNRDLSLDSYRDKSNPITHKRKMTREQIRKFRIKID